MTKTCPELKLLETPATNNQGVVGLLQARPTVVREGSSDSLHRCTAAMANRTLEGVGVTDAARGMYCERIHQFCPVFQGEGRLD